MTAATAVSGWAAEYEVDGEIVQTAFRQDGGAQLVTRSKFTVFVRDCSWLIQTTDHDEAGKPLVVRETACTNGAEIYEVSWPVVGGNAPGGRGPIQTWNVASIVSNNIPIATSGSSVISHLWLMFASGCYFADLSTNWITAVYELNGSVPADRQIKRKAEWTLINGPGSLPLSVVYFDGISLPASLGNLSLPANLGSMIPSTNATFLAAGLTNVGTIQIPSGFVFERRVGAGFAPGPILPGRSTPSYHFSDQVVASVTAVRAGCSRSDLAPTAAGMTMVFDHRLPPVEVPTDSTTFSTTESLNWAGFFIRFERHSDKVATFLWQKLSEPEQAVLTNLHGSFQNFDMAKVVAVRALNQAVEGPCIYERERFQGYSLRPETTNLLEQTPTGDKLAHLNRLLLEDAFPVALAQPAQPSMYVIPDGVQWLTVDKAKQTNGR